MTGGSPDLSEAAQDASRFGLPAQIAAQLDTKEAPFRVWPGNMEIVHAFIAVASQWRAIVFPNGKVHWQGLDYAGVRAGLAGARLRLSANQWAGLQIMERAAAAALNGYRA